MKTLGSIIIILAFAFIMLYGSVLIFNQAGANNDLDDKSIQLISQYDSELVAFQAGINSSYATNKDLNDYEPTSDDPVWAEARQFFETKDKVNQLKSTVILVTNLPDLLFLSIPFVDEADLVIYKIVAGLLLIITIFVAGITALFGKFWGTTNT